MKTVVTRLYEGLFLVDSGEAAADWQGIVGTVETILNKAGAEIASITKWDDRKLAYEVNGKSRGTYLLAYFNVDPLKIAAIERDVQLSEKIMRVMILRTEKMNEEDMKKDTPARLAEIESEKAAAREAGMIEKAKAEAESGSEKKTAPEKLNAEDEVTEDQSEDAESQTEEILE